MDVKDISNLTNYSRDDVTDGQNHQLFISGS